MRCPFCSHPEDRVLDTRVQKEGSIRRRRECLQCKNRFSTLETLMLSYPAIIKKDGRREAFSKEKILKGLRASCQKRPIAGEVIESIVEKISSWALQTGEIELPSRLIGKKVMSELRRLDDVAYVRFASVYRSFQDVQEFVESLEGEEIPPSPDKIENQLLLKPVEL